MSAHPGVRTLVRPGGPLALAAQAHHVAAGSDWLGLFEAIDRWVCDGKRLPRGSVSRSLQARHRRLPPVCVNRIALPHAAVRRLPRFHVIYSAHEPPLPWPGLPGQGISECVTLLVPYPASPVAESLLAALQDHRLLGDLVAHLRIGETDRAIELANWYFQRQHGCSSDAHRGRGILSADWKLKDPIVDLPTAHHRHATHEPER